MSLDEAKRLYAEKREALKYEDGKPCKHCGQPSAEHVYLSLEEIEKYRRMGSPVTLCEEDKAGSPNGLPVERPENSAWLRVIGKHLGLRCYIHPPPGDPCDEDFMEEISS